MGAHRVWGDLTVPPAGLPKFALSTCIEPNGVPPPTPKRPSGAWDVTYLETVFVRCNKTPEARLPTSV